MTQLWQELVQAGLAPQEAKFYLAVLHMERPSVAEAAHRAGIGRTNGYDIARRLIHRGLLVEAEVGPDGQPDGRGRKVLTTADPGILLDEIAVRAELLDSLVPQLRALRDKGSGRPRTRYLEGQSGVRAALFETLKWGCALRGILSMSDLVAAVGPTAMDDYIKIRRDQHIPLRVARSLHRESTQFWPSSAGDLRTVRFTPDRYVFDMTMLIGDRSVAMLAPRGENFAMMIESVSFAHTQGQLFEALWAVSTPDHPTEAGPAHNLT